MKIGALGGIVGIVIPILAATYGSINYAISLQNTIKANVKEITELTMNQQNQWQSLNDRIVAEADKLNIRVTNNDALLKQGREELLIEMTNFATQIARIQILAETLRDAQYKLASEAEFQAMEQSYYKLNDSLNQMKYDLKEMQRQLNGGY